MSFAPIPEGVRIVHLGKSGNQDIVNTIGCRNGVGAQIGDSLSVLAKRHGDAWRARIVPNLAGSYTHVATLAYSMSDQSLAAGDAGYSSTVTGNQQKSPEALNCCVVVSFKTAKRGRNYQGRTFLGPMWVGQTQGDGQRWNQTYLDGIQAAFASYKTDVDPTFNKNGQLAVLSHGNASKGIQPVATEVTSVLVRQVIGTQRRRLN